MGRASGVARWAVFVLISMVMLFPSWMMVVNSFSPLKAFLRSPPSLLPYSWTLKNYQRIFALPYLPRWVLNTVFLLVVHVGAGVLVNGAAGYVFAFSRARWIQGLFPLLMLPIFISGFVLIIPQFIIVGLLRMSGMMAVISMGIFWPTGIYLFRQYFRHIPVSLLESARLDGAGEWRILTQVVLPLSKPIIGTAVVFLGMGSLGSFVWPLLNLQTQESQTFLVGLMSTTISANIVIRDVGYDLAVGTMVFLPYLALFTFSSRYFISGLTGGALKE